MGFPRPRASQRETSSMNASAQSRHHAILSGQGARPMVFVHGFGCDRNIWRFVAPAFEPTHRVMVYDHAGCGDSVPAWDAMRHATLDGYAADLIDLLDETGLQDVVCVGHSVGSIISLLAALARPQLFSKLVLLAPSPRFLNDPPDYHGGFERQDLESMFHLMESNHFGWAQFLAPMAMGERNPVALSRDFERALCALEPRIARHFARLAFTVDVRDELPRVGTPSWIVQCSQDSIAPVTVGRWMHQHMPGSTLVELEASGHCPHVSHPLQTVDILRNVVDG